MRKKSRGAAAVEFALILPVLLLVILGAVEFAFRLYLMGSAAGAAREGARYYAVNFAEPDAAAKAEQLAANRFYETTPFNSGADPKALLPTGGDPERCGVTLTFPYGSLTGFYDFVGGVLPPITGQGVMRCGG